MAIYSGTFAVYERLASAKLNAWKTLIDAHTHDGTNGVQINFSNLAGQIAASQIPADLITGAMLADNSVTTSHIVNSTILIGDINRASIFLSADGYAVYAA